MQYLGCKHVYENLKEPTQRLAAFILLQNNITILSIRYCIVVIIYCSVVYVLLSSTKVSLTSRYKK